MQVGTYARTRAHIQTRPHARAHTRNHTRALAQHPPQHNTHTYTLHSTPLARLPARELSRAFTGARTQSDLTEMSVRSDWKEMWVMGGNVCETGFSSGRERIPQFSITEREDYSILYLPPSLPPSLSTSPPPPSSYLVLCFLLTSTLSTLFLPLVTKYFYSACRLLSMAARCNEWAPSPPPLSYSRYKYLYIYVFIFTRVGDGRRRRGAMSGRWTGR